MIRGISVRAYAKINFGLRVLPKRSDGFHDIESIFQTIDVYDELLVTPAESEGCIVHCDSMQLPENNTLTNAFTAFCEITGKNTGVLVELKKGIPAGGGLGGGSSDAAALIRALEKLNDVKLSDSQLDYIASKTGSDVFFFMHCDEDGKGTALVSGRGEVVRRIRSRKDLNLIVLFPEVASSTKEAYQLVDEAYDLGKVLSGPSFQEFEQIYNNNIKKWTFTNTFTPVISNRYEVISKAINDLRELGCDYAEMSGSGSTVFGVFDSYDEAQRVYGKLSDKNNIKLVKTI